MTEKEGSKKILPVSVKEETTGKHGRKKKDKQINDKISARSRNIDKLGTSCATWQTV